MENIKKFLIVSLSLVALSSVAYGVYLSRHSSLFMVKTVQISTSADQDQEPPLQEQVILQMAAVPIGKVSLFDLDLNAIEKRLINHHLIRNVRLEKRIPHTLLISIQYREPRAIIQISKGSLAYVDEEGKIFNTVDLNRAADLPFLVNFANQSHEKIREALHLLKIWESSPLHHRSLVSSIQWDSDRGYRFLIAYPLGNKNLTAGENLNNRIRAMVDFGQLNDQLSGQLNGKQGERIFDEKLNQLSMVLNYLSENSIAVRQIWTDIGKKIVVKTVHGS